MKFAVVPTLFAFGLLPFLAFAQDPSTTKQEKKPLTPRTGERTTALAQNDALLAEWLIIENDNEIAVAQLAESRAENPQVKEFARKMIEEHRQFGTKLRPFAQASGAAPGLDPTTPPRDKPATGTETEPGATGGSTGGTTGAVGDDRQHRGTATAGGEGRGRPIESNADHIALLRDLGQKCRQTATQELGQKSGREFDTCYMSAQVFAHHKVDGMLDVFQNYASDSLRSTLAEGQKTVRAHLEHAKTLCKTLDDGKHGDEPGKTDKTNKTDKIGKN